MIDHDHEARVPLSPFLEYRRGLIVREQLESGTRSIRHARVPPLVQLSVI
jgi:hypothetical protein